MSRRHTQLGFDFFDAAPAAAEPSSALAAPTPMIVSPSFAQSVAQSVTLAVTQLVTQVFSPVLMPAFVPMPPKPVEQDSRPSRGRTAVRARTAVLFSRLEDLGLRGVDALVLMMSSFCRIPTAPM